jgi:long-chain acyl-CoA synthetase
MIYGDRKPHLVALLVPDAEIADLPDLQRRLSAAVDRVNHELSVIERIRRFALADAPFTIENEQMTPSLKIRRHVIKAAYRDRLEALYGR